MANRNFIALLLITAVALMAVALYNGFPLTEGDTGAYIQQAIYPHFAEDRPPFYGLFLRVTSLWTSLWFTVFAQCLILSFLLLKYIQRVNVPNNESGSGQPTSGSRALLLNLLIVFSIVSFTCVSWVCGYLMPDVFAGILLLAIVLFLSSPPGSLILQATYVAIILLAISVHNSHFLITALFSIVLLLVSIARKQKILLRRGLVLLSASALVFLTMCCMNAAKKYGFVFSRGKDVYLVARFAEAGILNAYLDENCGKKNLKLCAYRDQAPTGFSEFLWNADSPLAKMGGWDSCREEYGSIVHDVFTTPRYLLMFARKSVTSTLRELTQVQAPDHVLFEGKDLQPWKKVRQFFSDELPEYSQSLQNTTGLSATSCNYIFDLFFVLSSIWIMMFYRSAVNKEVAIIYCGIILFLFINAFVTATFATVIYRFQYRVFWILPATNAIVILKYYFGKADSANL